MKIIETTILVEDLEIEAYVGQHAPEREQLQTVVISIACSLKDPIVSADAIENTFDYLPIVTEVKALAVAGKRRLIETLAEEIALLCLNSSKAESVVVSIRKPNKLPGVKAVGITRTFKKEES